MRARALTIAALVMAGISGATIAACDLNPQPLPPADPLSDLTPGSNDEDASSFGGSTEDAGTNPAPPSSDGAVDGGDTRGDGGDAGDASDGDAAAEASTSG